MEKTELIDTTETIDPAATIQSLLSGAISVKMSYRETWTKSYASDKECKLVFDMIENP